MKALEKKSGSNNFAGKAFLSFQNESQHMWIYDTEASNHMTGSKALLHDGNILDYPIRIGQLDGSVIIVTEIGKMQILHEIMLEHVLYLSGFKHNLLSVSKLLQNNYLDIKFDKERCPMQDLSSKKIIATGNAEKGVYRLDSKKKSLKNEENENVYSLKHLELL